MFNAERRNYHPPIVFRHPDGRSDWYTDPWTRLLFFQNSRLLEQRYEARHGQAPSREKSLSIAAHIAQGHDYYDAAANAGNLAQPLLLYYGALALSRALILFSSREVEPNSLDRGHGMGEADWDEPVSADDRVLDILNFKVELRKSGTLRQLIDSTSNREWCMIRWADSRSLHRIRTDVQHKMGWFGFISEVPINNQKWTTTFGALVSRLPDVGPFVEEAADRPASCLPIKIVLYRGPFNMGSSVEPYAQAISCRVMRSHSPLPLGNDVATTFGIKIDKQPQLAGSWDYLLEYGAQLERSTDIFALLPHLRPNEHLGMYVIEPFEEGTGLSTIPTMLAASFCMGMLVRYHPTSWHQANSVEHGNIALPIIRELTSLLRHHFPREVVEVMERPHLPANEFLELPEGLDA